MRPLLFLIILIGVLSCRKEPLTELLTEEDSEVRNDKDSVIVQKDSDTWDDSKVYDTIYTGNHRYRLDAYVWRNFMPGGFPPTERGLISACYLIEVDSLTIPDHITLINQSVIHSTGVWNTSFKEIRKTYPWQWEGITWQGPHWQPGTEVDVQCEFRNEKTGKIYKLIARKIMIGAPV